jgi:hypothetical protein
MTDHIYALGQLLEKTCEYSIRTFHLFTNFKAACCSIIREKLFMAMEEFENFIKLINLMKATVKEVKCRVKIQNGRD